MELSLKDKVVLVTGSARRVGRAIALEFASHGANLVIHHNASPQEADSAAEEACAMGVEALVVSGNQSDQKAVTEMFEMVRQRYGRLDVLVNSAAGFNHTPLLDLKYDEWQGVIGTNLTGPFLCTQEAARLMIEGGQGGAIINISDNSGLNAWARRPAHSISKAGVIMLTKVSSLALAQHHIRVNCVVPGPVLRPADEPESALDAIAEGLPLKHIGNPRDIARACYFLATNDYATGSILRIDGGEGLANRET